MNIYKTQPPWDFLLSASRNSLQSYELSRLSHAANLRKEIGALLDQWIEENSAANLARFLMEHRERPEIAQDVPPRTIQLRPTAIIRRPPTVLTPVPPTALLRPITISRIERYRRS